MKPLTTIQSTFNFRALWFYSFNSYSQDYNGVLEEGVYIKLAYTGCS